MKLNFSFDDQFYNNTPPLSLQFPKRFKSLLIMMFSIGINDVMIWCW